MLNNNVFKSWNTRGSLRFDKQLESHNVSAFLGMELRETNSESNASALYGFDEDTYTSKILNPTQSFARRPSGSGPISIAQRDPTGQLVRNGSVFGNGSYDYKGKYIVTVSGRIDQSNFFGVKANLRRVPLWSAGLGWNIHREDFYSASWLPLFKLRASYGYNGNTNAGASSYATFRYTNETDALAAPLRNIGQFGELLTPNNPQLRWERIKIINIGIDYGIKNNRLGGSIEFYRKNGLDLLGPILTDHTTGVRTFTGNQASIKGSGVDLIFNTLNIISKSFQWGTLLHLSFNKDEVTAIGGNPPTVDGYPPYQVHLD